MKKDDALTLVMVLFTANAALAIFSDFALFELGALVFGVMLATLLVVDWLR